MKTNSKRVLILIASMGFTAQAHSDPSLHLVRETVKPEECSSFISAQLPDAIKNVCLSKCQAGKFRLEYGGYCGKTYTREQPLTQDFPISLADTDISPTRSASFFVGCKTGRLAVDLGSRIFGKLSDNEKSSRFVFDYDAQAGKGWATLISTRAATATYDEKKNELVLRVNRLVLNTSTGDESADFVDLLTNSANYATADIQVKMDFDSSSENGATNPGIGSASFPMSGEFNLQYSQDVDAPSKLSINSNVSSELPLLLGDGPQTQAKAFFEGLTQIQPGAIYTEVWTESVGGFNSCPLPQSPVSL